MNKTNLFLSAIAFMAIAGCTNMNPDVKYEPKVDADSYCAIGRKDSKIANKFWDKVEDAYNARNLYDELDEFEAIIVQKSQAAAQEYPVKLAKRSMEVRQGEVSYYPEIDAQTYIDMMAVEPSQAEEFYNEVVEAYTTDGLDEDLAIFIQMCPEK
jgi:hypothetical protein